MSWASLLTTHVGYNPHTYVRLCPSTCRPTHILALLFATRLLIRALSRSTSRIWMRDAFPDSDSALLFWPSFQTRECCLWYNFKRGVIASDRKFEWTNRHIFWSGIPSHHRECDNPCSSLAFFLFSRGKNMDFSWRIRQLLRRVSYVLV